MIGLMLIYLLSIKKGKKSELCNYRPISLTSILCKIMEHFIRDYIIQLFFLTTFLAIISLVS